MREFLLFLRTLLTGQKIGAVAPVSRFTVHRMCRRIDPSRCKVVVEYGPGTGSITRGLLRRLAPDALLIAIERNADFVDYLSATIKDPRLTVFNGNAENVRSILAGAGIDRAHCVVSSIPFAILDMRTRDRITEETYEALVPGGSFLMYQYSRAMTAVLRRFFYSIDMEFEWRNIPCTWVMEAVR